MSFSTVMSNRVVMVPSSLRVLVEHQIDDVNERLWVSTRGWLWLTTWMGGKKHVGIQRDR
jgi:hypothetical protein